MNGGASSSKKLSPGPYVEPVIGEHPDGFVLWTPSLELFNLMRAERQKAAEEAERKEQEALLAAGYIPHSRKHRLLSVSSSASTNTEMDCTEEEKGDFASSVEPSPTSSEQEVTQATKRNRTFK